MVEVHLGLDDLSDAVGEGGGNPPELLHVSLDFGLILCWEKVDVICDLVFFCRT